MKKLFLRLLLLGVLGLTACDFPDDYAGKKSAQQAFVLLGDNATFSGIKNIYWDMSQSALIAQEGPATEEQGASLYYTGKTLFGRNASINYVFVTTDLAVLFFGLAQEENDFLVYLEDFDATVVDLTTLYGAPTHENLHWSNATYSRAQEQLPVAYLSGHVKRTVFWELGDTSVLASFGAEGEGIGSSVAFFSEYVWRAYKEGHMEQLGLAKE